MRLASAVPAVMLSAVLVLQGCVSTAPTSSAQLPVGVAPVAGPQTKDFKTIVGQVEPVAESICRSKSGNRNCDFRIILDKNPESPPNAYQTLSESGRPILVINQTLIDQLLNADEIAFVLSHEAAHHISDHIEKQQANTYATALAAGLAAAAIGADPTTISTAQEIGAYTGSRVYSKNFELEADSMGAQIAYYAGYDPIKGVAYFTRARDPGDVFLGTHPPNAQRIDAVRQTMNRLQ